MESLVKRGPKQKPCHVVTKKLDLFAVFETRIRALTPSQILLVLLALFSSQIHERRWLMVGASYVLSFMFGSQRINPFGPFSPRASGSKMMVHQCPKGSHCPFVHPADYQWDRLPRQPKRPPSTLRHATWSRDGYRDSERDRDSRRSGSPSERRITRKKTREIQQV